MDCNKKLLSNLELLQETEAISSESENEFKEYFDSDDSIGDPDFHTHSSSPSRDSSSEEDLYMDEVSDNIGFNTAVVPEWKKVTGNSLKTNLPTTSSFSEIEAYFLFLTEDLLETIVVETNRNAQQVRHT